MSLWGACINHIHASGGLRRMIDDRTHDQVTLWVNQILAALHELDTAIQAIAMAVDDK